MHRLAAATALCGLLAMAAATAGCGQPSVAAQKPGSAESPPLRAAFYYPWYPEAWSQQGLDPFTKYHPAAGFYSSGSMSTVGSQIAAMRYGRMDAGIASWWGPGTATDRRVPVLLAAAPGNQFKWALLYEAEGKGNWSADEVGASLAYIRATYSNDQSYLRIDGRFVVFVYADAHNGCPFAQGWSKARSLGAYVVMKVFQSYRTCSYQADSWYQYAPANDATVIQGKSFAISPGFNKASETAPRLPRDPSRWASDIKEMVVSNEPLQLITTFNEWGEGTAVEAASEWSSPSGYGSYLDSLHDNIPSTPLSSP